MVLRSELLTLLTVLGRKNRKKLIFWSTLCPGFFAKTERCAVFQRANSSNTPKTPNSTLGAFTTSSQNSDKNSDDSSMSSSTSNSSLPQNNEMNENESNNHSDYVRLHESNEDIEICVQSPDASDTPHLFVIDENEYDNNDNNNKNSDIRKRYSSAAADNVSENVYRISQSSNNNNGGNAAPEEDDSSELSIFWGFGLFFLTGYTKIYKFLFSL